MYQQMLTYSKLMGQMTGPSEDESRDPKRDSKHSVAGHKVPWITVDEE